jgi:putative addiction module component (TIGR02574 family)
MPLNAEFENAALSLPSEDRAALAMRLMDSLSEDAWQPEDIAQLADERDAELESGKVQPLSFEEFVAGLDFQGRKQ